MAEYNAKLHVKTSTGYDDINLQTKSEIVEFDKAGTDLTSTNASDAIKEINSKVNNNFVKKTDVINNLVSTNTDKPLSANMGKALDDKVTQLNSALTTFNTIGFSLADSVGSYYIHAGKLVVGFVNAKATRTVTTMELNDMPEPQNDGYIIEALNSYNGEKYSIAYETDHWSLRADSRQIAADEWLRFPMVYLSK